jgi:hypothetical protein
VSSSLRPDYCRGSSIHAPSTAYRNKFSGKYDYRLTAGGVGHNIPQEAPQAFAQAVIDVDRL